MLSPPRWPRFNFNLPVVVAADSICKYAAGANYLYQGINSG